MNNSIIDTIKILLTDFRKLSGRVSTVEDQSRIIEALRADLVYLQNRLTILEDSQPVSGAVAVGLPTAAMADEIDSLLDLPLNKIIDIYHETPAILEPLSKRVALSPDSTLETSIVERNRQGNYWVLQLRSQGVFLFPRPGAFARLTALESREKLFMAEGQISDSGNHEFLLQQPATLTLIKRNERWQLGQKGLLKFGESPLGFRWQQEITTLQDQYQKFIDLLETVGEVGLESTLMTYRWLQSLEQRYGQPVSIVINTCMPMAYALYKTSNNNSFLVPCNVLTFGIPSVFPAWDRGISWETSIYAKFHSKDNRNLSRTSLDHPYLPNQFYLKELNWESTQTWAIANDYSEAAQIVAKLNGHWGTLDSSNPSEKSV